MKTQITWLVLYTLSLFYFIVIVVLRISY